MGNKKGNILQISGWIVLFSLLSIVYITLALVNFVVINDYAIYSLQNISETLEEQGTLKPGFSNITLAWGNKFTNFNFHLDDLWFLVYFIFIVGTITLSYNIRFSNYFGFFSYLFYGIMFSLFLLTIYTSVTNWFKDEILIRMIPNAITLLPKFYYYLEHIGIFSAIHIVICLLVNVIDFDFSKNILRKKQEESVLKDDEII